MKRFKRWLIESFLPVYLKKELMQENEKLREQIQNQQIHIRELNAYIEGLELGLRSRQRITVNNHTEPREVVKE